MSHITVIQTELKDPEALKAAARALGIEVLENATPRLYGRQKSDACDLVLKLPGQYDLGLKRNAAGTYDFVCDAWLLEGKWHGGINHPGTNLIGLNGGRLKQEYVVQKAMATARRKGQAVQRQQLPNGQVRLTIRGR